MAGPYASKKVLQQGTKRKRAEPVEQRTVVEDEVSPDDISVSSSHSSAQSQEAILDSFAEDVAEPVEAFKEAVTSATAFLHPSEQLSSLARSAAKVCQRHKTV